MSISLKETGWRQEDKELKVSLCAVRCCFDKITGINNRRGERCLLTGVFRGLNARWGRLGKSSSAHEFMVVRMCGRLLTAQ